MFSNPSMAVPPKLRHPGCQGGGAGPAAMMFFGVTSSVGQLESIGVHEPGYSTLLKVSCRNGGAN